MMPPPQHLSSDEFWCKYVIGLGLQHLVTIPPTSLNTRGNRQIVSTQSRYLRMPNIKSFCGALNRNDPATVIPPTISLGKNDGSDMHRIQNHFSHEDGTTLRPSLLWQVHDVEYRYYYYYDEHGIIVAYLSIGTRWMELWRIKDKCRYTL